MRFDQLRETHDFLMASMYNAVYMLKRPYLEIMWLVKQNVLDALSIVRSSSQRHFVYLCAVSVLHFAWHKVHLRIRFWFWVACQL